MNLIVLSSVELLNLSCENSMDRSVVKFKSSCYNSNILSQSNLIYSAQTSGYHLKFVINYT